MADQDWWFDLKTHAAVQDTKSSAKAVDRLGPYSSREEAERALEKVEERNESWDADDKWGED